MDDKRLIGEVPDAHGRKTAVYQDHDGVTLDLGMSDRNYTIGQAAALMVWLEQSINAAQGWANAREQDSAEA